MARTSACCLANWSCLKSIDFPKLDPAPDAAPENVETGTQNQEGMVGAARQSIFWRRWQVESRGARDWLRRLRELHRAKHRVD